MTIACYKPMEAVLVEIIHRNRKAKADGKYLDFLLKVYETADRDKTFAECLEAALDLQTGAYPTVERIERELASMGGAIRPLLVKAGIVEKRKGR